MLLKKVSIKNFKSIKHLEFDFPESNILVLVGENNAGKSNIIRAIDVICGESWYGKEKLEDHDFYLRNPKNDIEINLYWDDGRSVNFQPTKSKWGINYFKDWVLMCKLNRLLLFQNEQNKQLMKNRLLL